jgi:hypothetical protein
MIEIITNLAQSLKSRIVIAGFFAVWMVLLVSFSLMPMDMRLALTPIDLVTPDRVHLVHVTAHIIAFGVPAFATALLLRRRAQQLTLLGGLGGLGLAIEWCEHAIYLGPLETWDMRNDLFAVVGGYLLATLLRPLFSFLLPFFPNRRA